jgi:hypothetical protein
LKEQNYFVPHHQSKPSYASQASLHKEPSVQAIRTEPDEITPAEDFKKRVMELTRDINKDSVMSVTKDRELEDKIHLYQKELEFWK